MSEDTKPDAKTTRPMKAEESFHTYKAHVNLFALASNLKEDKLAPHVLLYGVGPNFPAIVDECLLLDELLWTKPKDATFVPIDDEIQEVIRQHQPLQRLVLFLESQFRSAKPLYRADRYGEMQRFQRRGNESITDGVQRFKGLLAAVRLDGRTPDGQEVVNALYIGLSLTAAQDLAVKSNFNFSKVGTTGNTYSNFLEILDELFSKKPENKDSQTNHNQI